MNDTPDRFLHGLAWCNNETVSEDLWLFSLSCLQWPTSFEIVSEISALQWRERDINKSYIVSTSPISRISDF